MRKQERPLEALAVSLLALGNPGGDAPATAALAVRALRCLRQRISLGIRTDCVRMAFDQIPASRMRDSAPTGHKRLIQWPLDASLTIKITPARSRPRGASSRAGVCLSLGDEEMKTCKECGNAYDKKNREFCSKRCSLGYLARTRTRPTAERFWEKVDQRGPDECWSWTAGCFPSGYGQFRVNQTGIPASRMAWILTHGEPAEGMCICHSCDNPPCCNPRHLWLGTHAENTRDSFMEWVDDDIRDNPGGEMQ